MDQIVRDLDDSKIDEGTKENMRILYDTMMNLNFEDREGGETGSSLKVVDEGLDRLREMDGELLVERGEKGGLVGLDNMENGDTVSRGWREEHREKEMRKREPEEESGGRLEDGEMGRVYREYVKMDIEGLKKRIEELCDRYDRYIDIRSHRESSVGGGREKGGRSDSVVMYDDSRSILYVDIRDSISIDMNDREKMRIESGKKEVIQVRSRQEEEVIPMRRRSEEERGQSRAEEERNQLIQLIESHNLTVNMNGDMVNSIVDRLTQVIRDNILVVDRHPHVTPSKTEAHQEKVESPSVTLEDTVGEKETIDMNKKLCVYMRGILKDTIDMNVYYLYMLSMMMKNEYIYIRLRSEIVRHMNENRDYIHRVTQDLTRYDCPKMDGHAVVQYMVRLKEATDHILSYYKYISPLLSS